MRVIPAMDIIDGMCVRLTQGNYTQKKVYSEDPLALAMMFEQEGGTHLHLVDLDGARTGRVVNWEVVEGITTRTRLQVDFGGGVKTSAQIVKLLSLGIKQVNVGSIAVTQPELVVNWIEKFGAEKIILSADVKGENVLIHGWQETSARNVIDFIANYVDHGITTVTCTDVASDGMLHGPNIALYRKVIDRFPTINLIASGGVATLEDLESLKKIGVYGAIVGKAIYENKIPLKQLLTYGSE